MNWGTPHHLRTASRWGPGSSKTWLCSKCSGQKYCARTANRRPFHFGLYIYVLHVSKIARNRPDGSDCAACCRHQAVHKEWGVLSHVETTIDPLNYLIIKMLSVVYPTSIAQMRKCSFGLWNWLSALLSSLRAVNFVVRSCSAEMA